MLFNALTVELYIIQYLLMIFGFGRMYNICIRNCLEFYLVNGCLCAEAMNQHDALLQIKKPIQQYALFYDSYFFFHFWLRTVNDEGKLLNVFPTIIVSNQSVNNFPSKLLTYNLFSTKVLKKQKNHHELENLCVSLSTTISKSFNSPNNKEKHAFVNDINLRLKVFFFLCVIDICVKHFFLLLL